jgi:hypothetical protein
MVADQPKEVLINAVKRIKGGRHHPNAVAVQFVQIGDEKDAIPILNGLRGSDVDVGHLPLQLLSFSDFLDRA